MKDVFIAITVGLIVAAGLVALATRRRKALTRMVWVGILLVAAFTTGLIGLIRGPHGEAKAEAAAASRCPAVLAPAKAQPKPAPATAASSADGARTVANRSRPARGGRSKAARDRARRAAKRRKAKAKRKPSLVAVNSQARATQGAATMRMAFSQRRDVIVKRQTFRVRNARPGAVKADLINDLTSAGTFRTLSTRGDQLLARVQPSRASRRLVHVDVCFDPQGPAAMKAGRYDGSLLVAAGTTESQPIALTITARDERFWLPILFALAGLIAGVIVRWGIDRRLDAEPATRWDLRLLLVIGGGVAAGVYSYLTIYANEPTFEASFANLWRITAETFAGTLAAKAVTDLMAPGRRSGDDGEDDDDAREAGRGHAAPDPPDDHRTLRRRPQPT